MTERSEPCKKAGTDMAFEFEVASQPRAAAQVSTPGPPNMVTRRIFARSADWSRKAGGDTADWEVSGTQNADAPSRSAGRIQDMREAGY